MLNSTKKIGKYEESLFAELRDYFSKDGYSVEMHSRLNIAWSPIISDVDVIAFNNDETIIVEVKSSKDNFSKAFEQLKKVKDFSDKVFIATDKKINHTKVQNWLDNEIGLLIINDDEVKEIIAAKKIKSLHNNNSLSKLKKKCLIKLVKLLDVPSYLSKKEMENRLRKKFVEEDLKRIIKQIALCSNNCQDECILEPYLVEASYNIREKLIY